MAPVPSPSNVDPQVTSVIGSLLNATPAAQPKQRHSRAPAALTRNPHLTETLTVRLRLALACKSSLPQSIQPKSLALTIPSKPQSHDGGVVLGDKTRTDRPAKGHSHSPTVADQDSQR
ncbi:hypothetical protein MRS44_000342 [Fusarium solani]|uniref:uncharacterized protein n=1 Tax=Fusarium solani TaxID=169388 RepID=UPI00230AD11B|nr:hypothetical protein MRS44_000342 [Fusarium solani]KAJ4222134.1 hypothetical protein NW759_006559 [Fusarium solani]